MTVFYYKMYVVFEFIFHFTHSLAELHLPASATESQYNVTQGPNVHMLHPKITCGSRTYHILSTLRAVHCEIFGLALDKHKAECL
jgi:hypothetical protein